MLTKKIELGRHCSRDFGSLLANDYAGNWGSSLLYNIKYGITYGLSRVLVDNIISWLLANTKLYIDGGQGESSREAHELRGRWEG